MSRRRTSRFGLLLAAPAVAVGVAALTVWSMTIVPPRSEPAVPTHLRQDLSQTIAEVNAALDRLRNERPAGGTASAESLQPVSPAPRADDLTILRRLSLALHGTIPSLEEIRRFEADDRPDRLQRWTAALLEDPRFSDYFAERLARAYVGVEQGQFLLFRRDRFLAWLSGQLRNHRPYDAMMSDMLAARGVWTGAGEVNFLTAAHANGEFDANKLAARTARALLGQRLDCAQCHNHPFDHWRQSQFEGLAAYFGQLDVSIAGVNDQRKRQFTVLAADGETQRTVEPAAPFDAEWLPPHGSRREQLAAWVTHPDNRRFDRAIANRVWGLLFGRPFAYRLRLAAATDTSGAWIERAVDDLPDPDDPRFGTQLEVLDILGRDFRAHDCDLRRLILVIAGSEAFQLASTHPDLDVAQFDRLPEAERDRLRERSLQIEARWGVFPLVRLRPEQVIGAMLQASHVATIDQNSHLFVRAQRFFRERDFVDDFGDPGADELEDRTGTIQQALLRMNGDFAQELSEDKPFAAPGQIRQFSSTPERQLENIFLSSLSRRPTEEEQACFLPQLQARGRKSDGVIQDLYWAIYNSPEFSWNH